LIETESHEKYHINLEKVKEKYYNINERKNLTKLEKELVILVLDKKEEIKEVSKGENELMEVGKKIEDLSFDINMIGLYDEEEERRKVESMKRKYHIEQESKKSSLEIAKRMLKENINIPLISKLTLLSEEEILKL